MAGERLFSGIPIGVLTDSYKAGHPLMYPESTKMVAYGEFRKSFQMKNGKHDTKDKRLVFYGMRYIIESYLCKQWTMQDIEEISGFYSQHLAPGYNEYPFPKDIFIKFVKENNGYFPIKVEALPEGSVVLPHTPVYQITSEDEYAPLCTFMETLFTQVWYPSCVATLSRRCKDIIQSAFDKSVDPANHVLVNSRLHDFGFRGCTCAEQSVLGGTAHLLNFEGTDTMSAAFYAQYRLNEGRPVGNSIPATEHSVMTSWETEHEAVTNMVEKFGGGLFACVMDSYDYLHALEHVLPTGKVELAKRAAGGGAGGFMIIRPDSGDPVDAVLDGLRALEKVFGVDVNTLGYKVPKGASVIQGDGIDIHMIEKILEAVLKEGFSAQSVGFGMGGGLLQKVNRDTMSFATKLSYIRKAGEERGRDVMKAPKTDLGKFSLPGILQVQRDFRGVPMVYTIPSDTEVPTVAPEDNMLQVVYDKGPVDPRPWETFDRLRERVEKEWKQLENFKTMDPLSHQIKNVITKISPAHGPKREYLEEFHS